MKKIFTILTTVMLLSVMLVAATPADTIKDGTATRIDTGDGGVQMHVSNALGLNHCVLKPMYKDGELTNQRNGWVAFGPFWMKCNSFGPK